MKRKAFLSALMTSVTTPFVAKSKEIVQQPDKIVFDNKFTIRGEDLMAVINRQKPRK